MRPPTPQTYTPLPPLHPPQPVSSLPSPSTPRPQAQAQVQDSDSQGQPLSVLPDRISTLEQQLHASQTLVKQLGESFSKQEKDHATDIARLERKPTRFATKEPATDKLSERPATLGPDHAAAMAELQIQLATTKAQLASANTNYTELATTTARLTAQAKMQAFQLSR